MSADPLELLINPTRLLSRDEVLSRENPVPAAPGIYGWYFRESPHPEIEAGGCASRDGMPLLYVGIAPKAPPALGTPSRQTLRSRVRYHYGGNAEGSTLRLTLGCLLAERIGVSLRRVGSGTRLTFTNAGEQKLSDWMAENALVTVVETTEPWLWEDLALQTLDLPLNLRDNVGHPFHPVLTSIRAAAKASARQLDVFV
jgi:hypothetical protein